MRELQAELPEQQFNTWIRPLQAVEGEHTLRLLAPNHFVVEWLKRHHFERITELVGSQPASDGRVLDIIVEVGSVHPVAAPAMRRPSAPTARPTPQVTRPAQMVASRLNPLFRFDAFVEGKSNQLAKAAAVQVSENPGKSYNPLFIYGGVGLGKTHLMQSIGER